ncbi:MAG: YggS family pyridoxal phosphate-dependent enzyme [Planctomycetes bacterium]|nr:YggS family pyridoxal phosphate-dependent enzyme [Planctomycetota bacterium]
MLDLVQQISDNVACVQQRIAKAAEGAGRTAEDVQLVAVSKYFGIAESAALLAAGCQQLGESRPQQLWDKAAAIELANTNWHLIGHLQRNKVRRTLPLVSLIHSVDSLRLLKTIDQTAKQIDRKMRVLLEVNCSGDVEKHGLTFDELKRLLDEAPEYDHVEIRGLMTMAARQGGETVATENFSKLRLLRDEAAKDCPPEVSLNELSMGMSHDFETAIYEGATIVRIGSLLFDGIAR